MNFNLCFFLFIGLIFFSCKKKEQKDAAEMEKVVESPYTESTSKVYSGSLYSGTFTMVATDGKVSARQVLQAFFSKSVTSYVNPKLAVRINTIKYNGMNLNYTSDSVYGKGSNVQLANEFWEIKGANEIPSFNYRSLGSAPGWDSVILPDTIFCKKGFSVKFNGVANVTEGSFSLIPCLGVSSENLTRTILNGDTVFSFNADNCSVLSGCEATSIYIGITQSKVLNFYGKDFVFNKSQNFYKDVVIIH